MYGSLEWSCSESGMRKTAFRIGVTTYLPPSRSKTLLPLYGAGGGVGWQQALMEPDFSLLLLLPSKLRYWESVSQYGCTRVQQHLYQTEATGSGQESGFSKEHANMKLWTPWDRESTFLPASSMHQDIAHSYPRSLPALILSDARDLADPRKLQNLRVSP